MPTTDVHGHTIPRYGAIGEVDWRAIERLALSTYKPKAVANVTARAQYIADLAALDTPIIPSASNPVMVFRTDATDGLQYEVTIDGTNWRALPMSEPWTDLTLVSGYSAVDGYPCQYRVIDGWCELRGYVQSTADVPTSIGNLVAAGGAPPALATGQAFALISPAGNSTANLMAAFVALNPRNDGGIRVMASASGVRRLTLDSLRYRTGS